MPGAANQHLKVPTGASILPLASAKETAPAAAGGGCSTSSQLATGASRLQGWQLAAGAAVLLVLWECSS